jgi:site-specific DNA recombinase
MRVSIYARYSSDKQREASIEDQVRLCEERAARENWRVVNRYTDHAVSGASLMRRGIQALMQDAQSGEFDLVLTESLDRISRDQEDIAGVYKRLRFAGVTIPSLLRSILRVGVFHRRILRRLRIVSGSLVAPIGRWHRWHSTLD